MPRTKRKFDDDDDSSDENGNDPYNNSLSNSTTTTISRSTYSGGGKQLSRMMGRPGGGGKQMRSFPQGDDDDDNDSEDDSEDDSEEEEDGSDSDDDDDDDDNNTNQQHNTVVIPRGSGGGGKVFRSTQGSKILRPPQDSDHNSSSNASSDADSDSDDSDTNEPASRPPPQQPMYRAAGGGKSLSHMQRPPVQRQKSVSSSSEEEEDSSSEEEQAPQVRVGLGKQLRPPPVVVQKREEGEEHMQQQASHKNEDSEEEEEDDSDNNEPNANNNNNNDQQVDNDSASDDSDDSDEEPTTTTIPTPAPRTIIASQRGGKILRPPSNDKESDDMETSSSSSSEEDDKQDDMETSDEEEEEVDNDAESDGEEEEEDSDEEEETELGDHALDERKLVEGVADKKYLDSLPEIERESILAQRYEKLKNAADMKKALLESKRKEREQKKLLTKGSSKKSPAKSSKKKKTKSPSTTPTKQQKASFKPTPTEVGEMDVSDDDDSNEEDANNTGEGATTNTATTTNNTTYGDEDDGNKDDKPDTTSDYKLAQELALGRDVKNRDKTGGLGAKKQAALEQLRQASAAKNNGGDEDSDSEMDYGTDNSDDEYDDSDKPWANKANKSTKVNHSSDEEDGFDDNGMREKGFTEADVRDFVGITIPRRRLQRWVSEPYFDEAVKNFFVRLAIGRDTHTQRACYRLCKIIRIEKGQEYQFPLTEAEKHQKPVKTNKWLLLKFADQTRNFKMIGISDSRPSQDDVSKYLTQVKNRRGEVPSKKEAQKMRKAQDHLVSTYVYTKEDIDKTIAENKNMSRTISNIGAEKSRVNVAVQASVANLAEAKAKHEELEKRHYEAVDQEDEDKLANKIDLAKEEIADAEADVEKMKEEQKKVLRAEANRKIRSKKSKLQDLVALNERAKKANKVADVEAYRIDKERIKKNEAGVKPAFNPYARRQVKAKILWQVGQEKEVNPNKAPEVMKTEKKEEVIKAAGRDDSDEGGNDDKDAYRDQHNGLKEKLVVKIQDLAIDDENFLEDNDDAIEYGFGDKPTAVRVRKGISLEEYFERKKAGTL